MKIYQYGNKKLFYLGFVLLLIVSTNSAFMAYIVGRFIDIATRGTVAQLIQMIIISAVGIILYYIFQMIYIEIKNRLVYSCNVKIKEELFDHILKRPNQFSTKQAISYMTNDMKQLEIKGILNELLILQNGLLFIFALSYGLFLNIETTLFFFFTSLVPIFVNQFFSAKIKTSSTIWSDENSEYVGKLTDSVNGLDTILNYHAQESAKKSLFTNIFAVERALKKMNNLSDFSSQTVVSLAYLLIFCVSFSFGIFRVLQGALTIGGFMAIVQLSNSLVNPLFAIVTARNEQKTTTKLSALLATIPSTKQKTVELVSKEFEELTLKDAGIYFNDRALFEKLNITIKKGDKILILAPSGYGKSTLLRAIGGFIPFTTGTYQINQKMVPENSLLSQFAMMKQAPFIFDDTILFNLTMGHEYPNEKIEQAIADSQLSEVIAEKGLNFQVGEKGKYLSGGQLQRIEIARALLADRPVILADEVTSALDPKTSERVTEFLLTGSFTLIEIAHKTSEANKKRYTKIIQLDQI